MADEHKEHEEGFMSSVAEKISEKLHMGHSSSSSSSDDEDEKHNIKESAENVANRLFGRKKPVHKILGGGKAADSMLWKDKKRSGSLLAGATVLWILFECMGYHLLTFVCHVLILSLAVLFVWINSAVFLKRSPPHIPEVVISEDTVQRIASEIRHELNAIFGFVHSVAMGRDLKKYLVVIGSLWLLSVLGSCCDFLTLSYILLLLSHFVPVLYDKYEDHVDSFAEKSIKQLKEQYKVVDAKVLSKIPRGPLKDKKSQ